MARTPLFAWLGQMTREALRHQSHPIFYKNNAPAQMATVTRREFLKTAAGASLTLAGLGLASKAKAFPLLAEGLAPAKKLSGQRPPVIIVGAGLGGLVTAYRLTQQGIPCEIFEASHRVGGRMFTRRNFNPDGMFVELGGELVDSNHQDIMDLCQELNLPLEKFPTPVAGIEPALFIAAGKTYTETEIIQAFEPLAKALSEDILKLFPDGEVQIPTYQNTCGAEWLDRLSLSDYLDQKQTVPGWLIRVIKAAYTGEYGLDASEQSALNLLLLIGTDTQDGFKMFGESDEAWRIQKGSGSLPEAVYAAIQSKVPVHFGCKLKGIRQLSQSLRLTFSQSLKSVDVDAQQAVMAIPFTVLRDVQGLAELNLSPVKLKAIREWGYGTNSKQMMGFKKRFWQETGQGYTANSGELFTDWASQCYWETSRLQAGQSGILTNFLGGAAGREASQTQWKKALQDLDTLYQGAASEHFDANRAFFNWRENPLAKGSYTCPRPGQYTTLMGAAGEPELDGRLLFAGEHCSVDWAGFMNGAAQSGGMVAKQILSQIVALESPRAIG